RCGLQADELRQWQIRELSEILLKYAQSCVEREIQTSSEPAAHALRVVPGIIDLPRGVSVLARPDQGRPDYRKTEEEFLQRTCYHLTTSLWIQCGGSQIMNNLAPGHGLLLFHCVCSLCIVWVHNSPPQICGRGHTICFYL